MGVRDDIAKRAAKRAAAPAEPPPRDLAARLARGKELRRHTHWPGAPAVKIDIVPLTYTARAEAVSEALKTLDERGIDGGSPAREMVEHAAAEHMVQILARAILDPETGERAFRSGAELGAAATEDEISWLWTEYSGHRQSVDPEIEELPEAEFERFLDASKKKDDRLGRAIASSWPKTWLLTSVVRLARSVTSSCSSTPSLGEGTSSESSAETVGSAAI